MDIVAGFLYKFFQEDNTNITLDADYSEFILKYRKYDVEETGETEEVPDSWGGYYEHPVTRKLDTYTLHDVRLTFYKKVDLTKWK